MNTEPVGAALHAITETKQLIEGLLASSETFDYHQAKQTLRALGRKARELGKLQARLQAMDNRRIRRAPNICLIDFRQAASVTQVP